MLARDPLFGSAASLLSPAVIDTLPVCSGCGPSMFSQNSNMDGRPFETTPDTPSAGNSLRLPYFESFFKIGFRTAASSSLVFKSPTDVDVAMAPCCRGDSIRLSLCCCKLAKEREFDIVPNCDSCEETSWLVVFAVPFMVYLRCTPGDMSKSAAEQDAAGEKNRGCE